MRINKNFFVISGGPGSGKTTVLSDLAKLGFPHVPEVARQIIREQMESGGNAVPWGDRSAYTELMLQRSIDSFLQEEATAKTVFADRGIPDTLGYARLIGLLDTEAIESACRSYRYGPVVFMAPPWEAIYTTDSQRRQDFSEAERTYSIVSEVYRECGYELIELPKTTVVERARFILDRVKVIA